MTPPPPGGESTTSQHTTNWCHWRGAGGGHGELCVWVVLELAMMRGAKRNLVVASVVGLVAIDVMHFQPLNLAAPHARN